MSAPARFLAADLGAESGRGVVGELAGDRLTLHEVHRFPNRPVRLGTSLHWDVYALWEEICEAIGRASYGGGLSSIGLDTWGVDFGLAAPGGALLGLPHTYRDSRTEGAVDSLLSVMPRHEVFGRTGIQLLPFNSLFQLHAMVRDRSPLLGLAADLLFMPDIFHFWLTGRRVTEFTFATTSQIYNPIEGRWDPALAEAAGFTLRLLQEIVPPGTLLGPVQPAVAARIGSAPPVVAVGTHDTASAVAAVPAEEPAFAYISSGTWSLVGAEVKAPVTTGEAERANFTSEGGVGGTFRLLKNVVGLWLVQGCRRRWGLEGPDAYASLAAAAAKAGPLEALVDPDDPAFFNPPDMVAAIESRLVATGQDVPTSRGGIVRAILESLALKYRHVLQQLAAIQGRESSVVHIVGGGARNALLCQFTADATGLPVVAGPVEATSIGNILVQAIAAGIIGSVAEGRALVRRSFDVTVFEPGDRGPWDRAYQRFTDVCGGTTS